MEYGIAKASTYTNIKKIIVVLLLLGFGAIHIASAQAPSLDLVDRVALAAKDANRSFNRDNAIKVYSYLSTRLPESDSENLMAVALCESGFNHQALNTKNRNGTSDGGIFQINSTHGYDSTELVKPLVNTEIALGLYEDSKLQPWYSSKTCWTKVLVQIKKQA